MSFFKIVRKAEAEGLFLSLCPFLGLSLMLMIYFPPNLDHENTGTVRPTFQRLDLTVLTHIIITREDINNEKKYWNTCQCSLSMLVPCGC